MAGGNVTIKLTDDQQKQFREATGKTVTELTLEPVGTSQLSDQDLEGAVGGTTSGMTFLRYDFAVVAVKTISASTSGGD